MLQLFLLSNLLATTYLYHLDYDFILLIADKMRNYDLKKREIADLITAINVKDCMLSDQGTILGDLREKIVKIEFENTNNEKEIQKLLKLIESCKEENNYLFEKLDKKTMKEKQLKSKINELDTQNLKLKKELDIDQDTESDSESCSSSSSSSGSSSGSGSESDPGSDSSFDFDRDNNGNKVYHVTNNNNNNDDNNNNNNNHSDNNINDSYDNNKLKIHQKENEKSMNEKVNSRISSEVPVSRGIAETPRYEMKNVKSENPNKKRIKSKNKEKNKAMDNRGNLIESDTNIEKINEKEERKKLQLIPRKELKNMIRKLEKEKKSNENKILSNSKSDQKKVEIEEKKNLFLIEKLKFDLSILLEEGKEVKKEKDLADKELLKKEKEGLRTAQTMVRID